MRFSGLTLAAVPPDKIETSVRILGFTIIYFGSDGSNWLIKFGVLVTFSVLIYSLGILYLSEIGATNFSFDSYLPPLDYSESLVVYSSSKSPLTFFLVIWCYWIIMHWEVWFFCEFSIIQQVYKGFMSFNLVTFNIHFKKFCIELRFRCRKVFFWVFTINIKPTRWSCRLPLKVIQILSTDHKHWLFDIFKSLSSFSTF